MHFNTLFILSLSLISLSVLGQKNKNIPEDSLKNYFIKISKTAEDTTNLLTSPGMNAFMAKKVNTYITGSSDLSLDKGYFIVDPTDGRLFIAKNIKLKNQIILTGGIKSNVEDKLSTLYSGEDGVESQIGLYLKGSKILFNNIKFHKNTTETAILDPKLTKSQNLQKNSLHYGLNYNYRIQLSNELTSKLEKERGELKKKLKGITDKDYVTKKIQEFETKRFDELKKEFAKKEAENVDKNNLYTIYKALWVAADLYTPFTGQDYKIASSFDTPDSTTTLYDFEGKLILSFLYENKNSRNLFIGSFGLKKNNNIKTDKLKEFSYSDFKTLSGSDTLEVVEIDSKNIHVGDYESFNTPSIKLQYVSLRFWKKTIGYSLTIEKSYGKYDPLNFQFGIPFNLPGKDKKTKADFELQLKWKDINGDILPELTPAEKFSINLAVGIPIGSN